MLYLQGVKLLLVLLELQVQVGLVVRVEPLVHTVAVAVERLMVRHLVARLVATAATSGQEVAVAVMA
jgi:hypothetical protein